MQIHRPLLSVTVIFALGVVLQRCVFLPFKWAVCLAALSMLLSISFFNKGVPARLFLYATLLFCGFLYSQAYQIFPEDHFSHIARYYRSRPVAVEGVIVSDINRRDSPFGKKTSFTVEVKYFRTKWGWKEKSGRLLVNIFKDSDLRYGDHIIAEGKLHKPFEFSMESNFSYPDYLYRQRIVYILSLKKDAVIRRVGRDEGFWLKAKSFQVRNKLSAVFDRYLSVNEAGIMKAVLLGERHHIPKHIRNLFVQTGTAHILAISGLHVGIITGLLFLGLRMLPLARPWQFVMTVLLLIFYAFLTGGRPSVVRATIMAAVFLISFVMERETESINSLSLAALILLLINPLNIFEVGFQLSFISVLTIICFYKRIMELFKRWRVDLRQKPVNWFCQSLAVSLSACLGVTGLIVYYFNIITPVTILANLLIIPFITVVVALGLGLILSALVISPVAALFAVCIKLSLNLMVICIYFFAHIPGAYFYFKSVSIWYIILYYILLYALILRPRRLLHYPPLTLTK